MPTGAMMLSLLTFSVAGLVAAATVAVMPAQPAAGPGAAWEIGPVIRGRNYSVGMPAHPTPVGRGWYFDFPYPSVDAGHVHYVTFNHGPMRAKSKIVVRYRIDAAQGVRFNPRQATGTPAAVSLFVQRRGDNWRAKGEYENYRWYAPAQTVRELAPGVGEIVVSLHDPEWLSVMGKPAGSNPAAFRDAIADAERVGLVFGSSAARGHGVYATGPARFTLLSFRIL